jgi:hypothetical protein
MSMMTYAEGREGDVMPDRRQLERDWTNFRKGPGSTLEMVRRCSLIIGLALIGAMVIAATAGAGWLVIPLGVSGSGIVGIGLIAATLRWMTEKSYDAHRSRDERSRVAIDVTDWY